MTLAFQKPKYYIQNMHFARKSTFTSFFSTSFVEDSTIFRTMAFQ